MVAPTPLSSGTIVKELASKASVTVSVVGAAATNVHVGASANDVGVPELGVQNAVQMVEPQALPRVI